VVPTQTKSIPVCPICSKQALRLYQTIASFEYFECTHCHALTIDPQVIAAIDAGKPLRLYNSDYWETELRAAKERAYGACMARMAEAMHYVQIPVRNFLDIGTGPGYFLDAVERYLPSSAGVFHGVEKFPPPPDYRSKSANYLMGAVADFPHKVDCGLCVEVIEHLTPEILKGLLQELASVSNPGALYIFNSGQPVFVKNEDPGYLDPTVRGHIVSYSVEAMRCLAGPSAFKVHAIPGKTWAMALEFNPQHTRIDCPVGDRIWHALPENTALLCDPANGSVLRILGLESARAYH
jgi:hypothetical protein